MVACACLIPAFAALSSFGWMGYAGQRLCILCFLAPFLALCVGVDDAFILVSSVRNQGHASNAGDGGGGRGATLTPAQLGDALQTGGTAITTTTATSVFAFSVAALTTLNLPGFVAFNLSLALSLALNYIGFVTLFPAMILLNERRIVDGRPDLFFLPWAKRKDGGGAGEKGAAAAAPQAAGAGEGGGDAGGAAGGAKGRCDVGSVLRSVIANKYAKLLTRSRPFQAAVVAACVGMFGASCYGATTLGRGMPDVNFCTDDSYLRDTLTDIETYYGRKARTDMRLFFEGWDVASPAELARAQALVLGPLQARGDVLMVDCWPQMYAGAVAADPGAEWRDFLAAHQQYAVVGATEATVAGSVTGKQVPQYVSCGVFIEQPQDGAPRYAQAQELYALLDGGNAVAAAANSTLRARVYHPSLPTHVARYGLIKEYVLTTCGCAVAAVALVLLATLPLKHAVFGTLNIMAIITVVLGFMAAIDENYSALTFGILVVAIGFCVDYTVHVLHFAAPASDPAPVKFRRSVQTCGYDVFHGCATAFLGVFMLGFAGSKAFRTFAALAMVITGVGGFFALAGLPSLLLLCSWCRHGDQACADSDEESDASNGQSGNHPANGNDHGNPKPSTVTPSSPREGVLSLA